MKLCIDCKHCITNRLSRMLEIEPRCRKTVLVSINPVNGKEEKGSGCSCKEVRFYGWCGFKALWFEAKK